MALIGKANAGDPEAQYQMGRLNFGDGGDKRQAAFWFGKAAEQGNDDAQFWLGTMYERGGVVEQDMAAALKWYQLSAKQGNPDAQVSLGQMYEAGNGVQQDYLEAEKWYRKAAEHFPDRGRAGVARHQLGNLYRDGHLVPNYIDAYMWFAIIGSVKDMKHTAKQMTPLPHCRSATPSEEDKIL
jgi:TPR repeat protein